jgi:hypothetical protein
MFLKLCAYESLHESLHELGPQKDIIKGKPSITFVQHQFEI